MSTSYIGHVNIHDYATHNRAFTRLDDATTIIHFKKWGEKNNGEEERGTTSRSINACTDALMEGISDRNCATNQYSQYRSLLIYINSKPGGGKRFGEGRGFNPVSHRARTALLVVLA